MRELRFQIPLRACFSNCCNQVSNRTDLAFFTEPRNPDKQVLPLIGPWNKIIPSTPWDKNYQVWLWIVELRASGRRHSFIQ